jgi:Fe2+ transport system protein B
LLRELSSLRELLETRLNGMDKAVEVLEKQADKYPDNIAAAVRQLQELQEERFKSIALQFVERDTRTEQTQKDSKVAVDAALQAAKEAVGAQNESNSLAIAKSEASTTKSLDAIQVLITATAKAADEKIDDLKGRLSTIEGRSTGHTDVWGYIVGIGGLLVAIATLVVFGALRH